MRIKTVTAILWIILASVSSAFAQNDEKSGMITSAKGLLVVWNEPGNYYTIEVIGKTITPFGEPPPIFFQVDRHFLQIQTTSTEPFLKALKGKDPDDKTILAAHRDSEANYSSGIVGSTLKIDSEWVKLPDGSDALAWGYDVPKNFISKGKRSAKRQLFLSVVKRDHVLLLNSAVTGEDNNEKALRQFLLETMKTLKSSDKPLSLKTAREQVVNDK